MEIEFVPAKPEDARFLSEMRRKVWLTTYRGIYPDKMLDEFDYEFHDNKNLSMINSEEFSVYFISEKKTDIINLLYNILRLKYKPILKTPLFYKKIRRFRRIFQTLNSILTLFSLLFSCPSSLAVIIPPIFS